MREDPSMIAGEKTAKQILVLYVEKYNVRNFRDFAKQVFITMNAPRTNVFSGARIEGILSGEWIASRWLLHSIWNRYCDEHPSYCLMKIDKLLADEFCEKLEEEFTRLHPLSTPTSQESKNVIKAPQSCQLEVDITSETNSKTENISLLLAIVVSLIVSFMGLFGTLEKGEGKGFFINTVITIGMFITCTAILFLFFQVVLEGFVLVYTRFRTFASKCKSKGEAQMEKVRMAIEKRKKNPPMLLFETSGGKVRVYLKPILIALAIIIGLILACKLFFSSPYTQIVGKDGLIYRLNKRTGETKLIYGNRMIDIEDLSKR